MIVPSIDLMNGNAVQLIGGRKLEIDAGDPRPIARKFGIVGEIAVIDLDAALGNGSNRDVILDLLDQARCRVGGGIRSVEDAISWLDAGAEKVIVGTCASVPFLSQLPRERLIAALDTEDGEVVVEGWRKGTGRSALERIQELRDHVSGFLLTFVEREGRLSGTRMEDVATLVSAAGQARVTIAGGVTTAEEIEELDRLGADAQVGMALYSGRMHLGDAVLSLSKAGQDLIPTVVVDEQGLALGLVYSNLESVRTAIDTGRGVYWSRQRGLWIKGEESGNTQDLLRIDWDCDRDCLRFTVRQKGPFCHLETRSCWGPLGGRAALEETIRRRAAGQESGSYTRRLLTEDGLLDKKVLEEAKEIVDAADPGHVIDEVADLVYFLTAKLQQSSVVWADVDRALDRRARKVSRRAGDAKL